jgi:cation transport regulator ChaC
MYSESNLFCTITDHPHNLQDRVKTLLVELNENKQNKASVFTLGSVERKTENVLSVQIFEITLKPHKLLQGQSDFWVFAYGSIIHSPGKLDELKQEIYWASLTGYARRFYQGSMDHRGSFVAPGRVLTLVPSNNHQIWGVAFRFEVASALNVLNYLTQREQGGYQEHIVTINIPEQGNVQALVYIALPDNPWYLGEAPLHEIAAHINASIGPSGTNKEYVVKLKNALGEQYCDEDIDELCLILSDI